MKHAGCGRAGQRAAATHKPRRARRRVPLRSEQRRGAVSNPGVLGPAPLLEARLDTAAAVGSAGPTTFAAVGIGSFTPASTRCGT